MSQSVAPMQVLRGLGEPGKMRALAAGHSPSREPLEANTHIHLPPNFSAFESTAQAAALAAEEGLALLGAGNYYDFSVYAEFAQEAAGRAVFPLFGVEIIVLLEDLKDAGVRINDPGNPGKMYICGRGLSRFAQMTPGARALMARVRRNDSARMAAMIKRLNGVFAAGGVEIGLDENAAVASVADRSGRPAGTVTLQERHVALAFQEALFERVPEGRRGECLGAVFGAPPSGNLDPIGVQNDIRARLMKAGRPAFVEERFLDFDDGLQLVLELGGIPVYPTLADGAGEICPFETPPEKLIERIKERGFHCAEFIPPRNRPGVLVEYVKRMRAAGLVVTAGTEHNTADLSPLKVGAAGGAALPEDLRRIFWEGACVAAAHQFLTSSGECGFVDGRGRPNRDYATAEERIAAFARLGAAVIDRFKEQGRQGRGSL